MEPDKRPKTRRRMLLGFGALGCLGYFLLSLVSWLNRRSAMACILEWGRLAPFPESARNLVIATEGGMFTRTFQASFNAPAEDIARWLDASPGTREASPDIRAPGLRRYAIKPGGGAMTATVDVAGASVLVYVCWS